ncbi:lysoplasmalogenase [Tupanvirus soda lake]|uniref:Lysoplasmalogenase n=2 Tax=Tupanvirus TaxID=2094720 RepID=A0A6N1NLA2_9VIRU|nr:lysoplasmalogenase [Tupanvirus soda lake]QKU35354.1 lysoplasmalogenase [Tupanvirus soda lake]
MDKKILILILTTILVVITSVVYIKFVIYDYMVNIKYFVKWIPVLLLIIQTLFFLCYFNIFKRDTNQLNYCFYLIFAYVLCMIGDISLMFDEMVIYMIGMLMFMIAYFLFGLGRIYNIKKYIYRTSKVKIILGAIFILIAQICYVPYVIYLASSNQKFDSIEIKIAICIYSCFINFSVLCNYIYLITFGTYRAWFSFVGVLIFGISDCVLILHDIKYEYKWIETLAISLYWIGLTIVSWATYKNNQYGYIILDFDV